MLVVIILIRVIYRHNPHVHLLYGREIVLFHSSQRYEKRIWRFNLIEFIKNQNNRIPGDSLDFKMVVGELSEDTLEIVKNAASANFDEISIIGGPQTFCEDKIEIYSLLDRFKTVKYHVLPIRPNKHFMIFNGSHLYIEKPHHHNEIRGSVGVKTAHPKLIQTYEDAYNTILKYAKQLNKEEVLEQQCYKQYGGKLMDITSLIPDFLVFSLAGSSLSITAYSAFRDKSDDKKLRLIIATCFSLAFVVVFVMTFINMDDLTKLPVLGLTFYILIFMAILSIIGFIIHRLMVDESYKQDELESAIDIIESSKNGLNSFIGLLKNEYKEDQKINNN